MTRPAQAGLDPRILGPVLGLTTLGVVMVYSASSVLAADRFGDGAYYLKRQLAWAAAGLLALWIAARVRLAWVRRLAWPLLLLAVALLALTRVPGIARTVGGAARWIDLGGLVVQPAEFAKLALVVWLAASTGRPDPGVDRWRGLLPRLAVVVATALLVVVQPDLGTAFLLALVGVGLLFLAGARPTALAALALAALPALYLLVVRVPYRRARLEAFLDPFSQASGAGWQLVQSFVAFGAGGLVGRGLGEGQQKLLFLPEPHTDFVAAVIAEELGLLGFGLVVVLYALLVARGFALARRAPEPFAAQLAAGVALLIGVQAATNLAVVLGCVPTKGLPLPFVSYGGSALVTLLAAAGLLLNVSALVRAPFLPRPGHLAARQARGHA